MVKKFWIDHLLHLNQGMAMVMISGRSQSQGNTTIFDESRA